MVLVPLDSSHSIFCIQPYIAFIVSWLGQRSNMPRDDRYLVSNTLSALPTRNVGGSLSGMQLVQYIVQCSPCKSNPDMTNFLLIRRFLESRHIHYVYIKNSNGMSCIIRSRVGLVYVHTREYQSFLITCVRLRYLRRPRSWS